MKKVLKRIGIGLLILIFGVLPLMYGVAYYFRDDIKDYALQELNKQLATKMEVNSVDFSLFSAFPNVSIKLTGVRLEESTPVTGEGMIEAKEVLLVFNIVKVLQKDFKFYKLIIKDAKLNLAVSKDGVVNYNVIKTLEQIAEADSIKAESVEIDFKSIQLVNTFVSYSNKQNNQGYHFHFNDAEVKGNFKDVDYTLSASAAGKILALKVDDKEYMKEKSLYLTSKLDVTGNHYQFAQSEFMVNGLNFIALGQFDIDDGVNMDIALKGEEMTIQSFLSLLPNDMAKEVNDLGSEGDFYFDAKLVGSTNDEDGPALNADFGVKNGTIKKPDMKLALTNVNTIGTLETHISNLKNTRVKLNNISALLNGKGVSGSVVIDGLVNPLLDIKSKGKISLEDVKDLVGLDEMEYMRGLVNFDIYLNGRTDDFKTSEGFSKVKTQGTGSFNKVAFKVADNYLKYNDVNGKLKLTMGSLYVEELTGTIADNKVTYKGVVENLLPYILKDHQQMLVKGNISSESLSVNALLPPTGEGSSSSEGGEPSNNNALANLPEDIKMALVFSVDKIKYDEFIAEKVSGKLQLTKDYLDLQDVNLISSGGDWSMKANLRPTDNDNYITQGSVKCSNVDIRELFRQFDNFGQNSMVYTNLKGRLSCKEISFACLYDKQFNAYLDELYTYADVVIEDGQLIDFEPLMGLSNHIKVDELKDVKFETLKNTIEIKNQTITIPNMEIKNSALNLAVSGTHTFENMMDYRFKIRLSDYLTKKYSFRSKINKDDYEESDNGAVNLYVMMTGHINNLVYKYDKQAVKQKVKDSFKGQGQEVKDVIKNEIKIIFKRNTDSTETQEIEIDETEFEWDEP